jgi:hypothetical protein
LWHFGSQAFSQVGSQATGAQGFSQAFSQVAGQQAPHAFSQRTLWHFFTLHGSQQAAFAQGSGQQPLASHATGSH